MIKRMYIIDLRSFRRKIFRALKDKETYKNAGLMIAFLFATAFVGVAAIAPDLVNLESETFFNKEESTSLFKVTNDVSRNI